MPRDDLARRLRDRLAGGRVHGVFLKLPGLETVDLAHLAGFDFAVLDLEHSGLDPRTAFDQLAYARALGLPCLVRLARLDAGFANRLLEAGAAGIQLADVTGADEAAALVAATRFPPAGERGVSPTTRAGDYGALPVDRYVAAAELPLLAVQIERGRLADPLADILAPTLDVCFLGAVDLSVDLNVPGVLDAPAVRARGEEVAAAARAAGVALGGHAGAGGAVHPDARYVTVGTDVSALLGGLRALRGGEAP